MLRIRLPTLLTVLALGLTGAWVGWTMVENGRDSHDMWNNPARYGELEEHLIKTGKAKRGPDGELRPIPKVED
jgi:hypothetical protein